MFNLVPLSQELFVGSLAWALGEDIGWMVRLSPVSGASSVTPNVWRNTSQHQLVA